MPALLYILLSIALALFAPWRPEPSAGYRVGGEPLRCRPPLQPARTFVGFPEGGAGLNGFEPAGLEATRILTAVQQQSCALGELQDAGGRLRASLSTGPLEIAQVLFQGADLNAAEIHLQPPSDVESDGDKAGRRETRPLWTLRVVCDEENAWQVVSSRLASSE